MLKIFSLFKKINYRKYFSYIFFYCLCSVSVSLAAPITFTPRIDLDFGGIVHGTTTSTFTLSTGGVLTSVSGDGEIYDNNAQAAKIRIGGDSKAVVDFTINNLGDLTGPGAPIPIRLYTIVSPITLRTDTYVGATIDIGATQTPGVYTGTYTIDAEYQSDPGTTYTSSALPVSVEIFAAPVGTEVTDLDFGRIAVDPAGGTVRVTVSNTITNVSGNAVFIDGHQMGQFTVTGVPNDSINLSFSSGNVLSGPGDDIDLGNFDPNPNSVSLDGSGNGSFDLGADLTYNTAQTSGSYTGIYTIFMNY